MMLSLLILMITSTTFTAVVANNPLTMALLILLLALMMSITLSISMSSWVALLIFLIYVGGMLVMFSYFIAITPNQNMSFSTLLSILLLSTSVLSLMSWLLNFSIQINSTYNPQMNTMYQKFNIPILLMLALILLFTMVVIVKLVNLYKGPLRPFYV